ncbi:type IV secretory system conjugative DNA transfer family protein [Yinghuangia soli]|uniref:Type IV secretory system conjugative DNA transfer family protein n=1 Tax=Yinghuangia soli TaxID=2908204 RepID=A0AA41U234_9ACTN|nr:TraM recognition domain-containing protein [Yinghuangia soli]MCF2526709.1 type IV secretory system conjugative DNA transfer family protein [Yinghuangia soli]
MSSTIRRRGPDLLAHSLIGALAGLNLLALVVAVATCARGQLAWTAATAAAVVGLDVLAALALRGRERRHVDASARYLQSPAHMTRNTTAGAQRVAEAMGYGDLGTPGFYLGRSVRGKRDLWGTWEDVYVEISGTGMGKTTARAIPNIVTAPGPVLVTSANHHVVAATRGIREQRGKTWVFDPQDVSGEPNSWYWSPLSMVGGDLKDAMSLTGLFISTQRKEHHRADAYFEPAAQTLIAVLMLAADGGDRPITDVLKWLRRPDDETPTDILQGMGGRDLAVDAVRAVTMLPAEQRAGVLGVARQYMAWLAVPEIIPWITPGGGREEFPFVKFARESTDTLYVMSRADDKTASPAVSALTAASVVAGQTGSVRMPGGRLRKPLLVVLDDPSNVAQIQFWPTRYSHFGSRGVIVMTLLQSWSQGVAVWGANGMAKLWGASSVRGVGGGGSETGMLGDIATMSGKFEARTVGMSFTPPSVQPSVTLGSRAEGILDPSDIAGLPRGRFLIQVSGRRPVLAESVPWTDGPHADAIRASIAKYARR